MKYNVNIHFSLVDAELIDSLSEFISRNEKCSSCFIHASFDKCYFSTDHNIVRFFNIFKSLVEKRKMQGDLEVRVNWEDTEEGRKWRYVTLFKDSRMNKDVWVEEGHYEI